MQTFVLEADNNINAFATPDEAKQQEAGAIVFTGWEEFQQAIAPKTASELVLLWNSFAGCPPFGDLKPVGKFTSAVLAKKRIWDAIQRLTPSNGYHIEADPAVSQEPAAEPEETPAAAPQEATPAPAAKRTPKATTRAKKATKPPKLPKQPRPAKVSRAPKTAGEPKATRAGSKKAEVIRMLQCKNGATLNELAKKFGWKTWTVRGFIAGGMKKAGYTVESFKPEGGERTYRIAS